MERDEGMNTRTLQVGLGSLVGIGVVALLVLLLPAARSYRGTSYDPALPAPEIDLPRADGSRFRLSAQQGQVTLLFFGYTYCPDVCPLTLSEMRRIESALGRDAGRVDVVFVTVDPDRDSPQAVEKFVSYFDPTFIGLSGALEELQPVWQAYGVFRELEEASTSAAGYLVNHTARVYVVDVDGNLRLSYSFGTPPEDIVHDIKLLLKGNN